LCIFLHVRNRFLLRSTKFTICMNVRNRESRCTCSLYQHVLTRKSHLVYPEGSNLLIARPLHHLLPKRRNISPQRPRLISPARIDVPPILAEPAFLVQQAAILRATEVGAEGRRRVAGVAYVLLRPVPLAYALEHLVVALVGEVAFGFAGTHLGTL
jgi:hypothetical protein